MNKFAVKIDKYVETIEDIIPEENPTRFIQLAKKDFFKLEKTYESKLKKINIKWGFGKYSEVIYYRTYSRLIYPQENDPEGKVKQETLHDTIIRVVNGVFTIRKNHYINHGIKWNNEQMQFKAYTMAKMMLNFKLLPPGRGLWACGTEQMYTRGSAALFNCGAVTTKNLVDSVTWCMDALMHGIGVGFDTAFDNSTNEIVKVPEGKPILFIIADTRESWVKSVKYLIESYRTGIPVVFDYSKIRKEGLPIKTFGGISCGYKPLKELHDRLNEYLTKFLQTTQSKEDCTRLVADIFNALGYCVVSGNVRRSAEIILGDIHDKTFLNLKNLDVFPERQDICWMSNNTVVIKDRKELGVIDNIIDTLKNSGEPGILYLPNIQQYARMYNIKPDNATLCNPCGEIPLESYELCNLCEVFPSNCNDLSEFLTAVELAGFYCSTVNLLDTHSEQTNAIIKRNRRIGVSLSGIADFIDSNGLDTAEIWFNEGYEVLKSINHHLAIEAQINDSVRLTTVKPSGTVSILAGVSPGLHYGIYKYCVRRVRVSKFNRSLVKILQDANIPYEDDLYTRDTYVFEFPLKFNNTRAQNDIPLWEQFSNLAFMQRVWSDNMVSVTATFNKSEIESIPKILNYFLPQIKGCSLLPKIEAGTETIYKQVPFEEIKKEEYTKRLESLKDFDWSLLCSDGQDTRFCNNASCEV